MWFSSITNEERENLERVQRVACKIILKGEYKNYNQALSFLNLQNLSDRRQMLAGRFAIKCVKSERFCDLFPLADNTKMDTRSNDKYVVNFANTDRLRDSSIPAMQRILNKKGGNENLSCLIVVKMTATLKMSHQFLYTVNYCHTLR